MKSARLLILTVLLALAAGCASKTAQSKQGAQAPGAPKLQVSPRVIDLVDPPDASRPRVARADADKIVLPACYRLVLVDGKQVLVRETDAQAIQGNPGSLRIVTGEIARGEISYQPGLVDQELAEEVVRTRQSQAAADNAAINLTNQSAEVVAQSKQLQAQNKALAIRLAQIAAYTQSLEEKLAQQQQANPPAKNPPAKEQGKDDADKGNDGNK
jgi:hypothetical protein